MPQSDRESVFSAAGAVLSAMLPNAWAIYVYGSFARKDEWPDSDIDLAVLLPPGERISDRLALMAEVSKQVHRDVDIVNLREAGLDLVREVLRDGQPLQVRCPDDTLGWEAERMTDYADFNPRRADLVAMYMREPLRTQT